jgi:hypothetical protein
MGILDGGPYDPAIFQQASEAATPGWLDHALPPPGVSPGLAGATQPFAGMPGIPAPASLPAGSAQGAAGNPFAALFGGLGAAFSPAGAPAANGPGLGARANAAMMNFLNGHGVLPAIGGAITGAATGQRTDPVGLMQAQQAATVRALVGVGIRPDVAQAATLNPDIMRLIAPQLLGALARDGAAPPPARTPPEAAAAKALAQASAAAQPGAGGGVAKPQYPTE